MVELFGRDKSVVSRYLNNIFKSGELKRDAVVAKNATTGADGKTYQVDYFNLDAIISVGYRVNSIPTRKHVLLEEYRQKKNQNSVLWANKQIRTKNDRQSIILFDCDNIRKRDGNLVKKGTEPPESKRSLLRISNGQEKSSTEKR
jgi:hypothetical protein